MAKVKKAEAVADKAPEAPGEGEDHAAAFERHVERLQQTALDAEFESGTLVGDIRDVLLDTFKLRPKPWAHHSESEQRDLAKALENVAKTVIRKVVFVVAEQDEISVTATVKGYSAKGGVFKINAEARGDEETATQLFGMDGHDVVIMSADSARFTGQKNDADVQPDAPGLPFSDPASEEVDLEAAAEPPVIIAETLGANERVNLKTGMVERPVGGVDWTRAKDWKDVRDATPEELAAERESQADFSDDKPETKEAEGVVDA